MRRHRRDQRFQVGEPHVAQLDEGLDRLEFDLQPHRIAERAVGVGEAEEQIGVLVGRSGGDDLTGPGQHVDLQDGFVRQPASERRRLDAEPGHRPAQRDCLELRNDQWRQAVGQCRRNEVPRRCTCPRPRRSVRSGPPRRLRPGPIRPIPGEGWRRGGGRGSTSSSPGAPFRRAVSHGSSRAAASHPARRPTDPSQRLSTSPTSLGRNDGCRDCAATITS